MSLVSVICVLVNLGKKRADWCGERNVPQTIVGRKVP